MYSGIRCLLHALALNLSCNDSSQNLKCILQCTLKSTWTWPNTCVQCKSSHMQHLPNVHLEQTNHTMHTVSNNIMIDNNINNYRFLQLSHITPKSMSLSSNKIIKTVLYGAVKSLFITLPVITSEFNLILFNLSEQFLNDCWKTNTKVP